jgi:predicted lactoylglutathione lyase
MSRNYLVAAMSFTSPGSQTPMERMIFLNLPVVDVEASTAFYTGLGFSINQQFSNSECACIVISDTIYVMALSRRRFADFVPGPVGDPTAGTTAISCLSASSRQEVDDLVARALTHGGKPWMDPVDEGFMYGHSFADPDGHAWEVVYMEIPG